MGKRYLNNDLINKIKSYLPLYRAVDLLVNNYLLVTAVPKSVSKSFNDYISFSYKLNTINYKIKDNKLSTKAIIKILIKLISKKRIVASDIPTLINKFTEFGLDINFNWLKLEEQGVSSNQMLVIKCKKYRDSIKI
jgi:hypothetical protein